MNDSELSPHMEWRKYSKLMILSDNNRWVLAEEAKQLRIIAARYNIETVDSHYLNALDQQVVFYLSHFHLLLREKTFPRHRVAMSYLHGLPGTGFPLFERAFERFITVEKHIAAIHVCTNEMLEFLLDEGVESTKIHHIPLSVDSDVFLPVSRQSRQVARKTLAIPESAVVVGSFQRDGKGWGEGEIPRLEKGPDVLIDTLKLLKPNLPKLFVLLSGPARGYVIRGLRKLNIPYRHVYVADLQEMTRLYHAIDVYLVSSRQEGGPKALLEAWACRIPVVATKVGLARDQIVHGENGWLADVEDTEALANWVLHSLRESSSAQRIVDEGYGCAFRNRYSSHSEKWFRFFDGLIERSVC